MKGKIHLIKISEDKIVPALCMGGNNKQKVFAQLRTANKEEIISGKRIPKTIVKQEYNKGRRKKNNRKKKVDEQKESIKHNYYIGNPVGLKNESVVMLARLYIVDMKNILREISEVTEVVINECVDIATEMQKRNELHKELHNLKKKIHLAELNNKKHSDLENRVADILKELGYKSKRKVNKKGYGSYRVVPNDGPIKVYLGGR